MTTDVDMTDASETADRRAKDGELQSIEGPVLLDVLRSSRALIVKAVDAREAKLIIGRVLRQTATVRSQFTKDGLKSYIMEALHEGSAVRGHLEEFLSEEAMDAYTAPGSLVPGELHSKAQPEQELYCLFLVCQHLVDQKYSEQLLPFTNTAVSYAWAFNRRTLDVLQARVTYYQSFAYEKAGRLAELRRPLLEAHCRSVLRHDAPGQEVLLNLLLRNYLHDSLYDQAEKLRAQAHRPEGARSNTQYSRYLFYLGRIRAVQLEYTEAKECLQQAARKAPMAAVGFGITVAKWLLVVRLLLGEDPERADFEPRGGATAAMARTRAALRPYLSLAVAVRGGDVAAFSRVEAEHHSAFETDRTMHIVGRLRYNVLRAGLRRISLAYSRISLEDIAFKLGLSEGKDVESVVAKTIRDGSISAILDHEAQVLVSREVVDAYITAEPQQAFHARTAFCMDVHNEAVRAMRYDLPGDRANKDNEVEKQADLEEKIAAALAEGEDEF